MKKLKRVIALEEAFWIPSTREMYPPAMIESLERLTEGRLSDVGEERIRRMDEAGIDVQVLSHVSPGAQGLPDPTSRELARFSNDWLGQVVQNHPTRFKAFASLPTRDPALAVKELERTVNEYSFCGALINGPTDGQYLDDQKFWPIFECAQALDVPIYIHPNTLAEPLKEIYFNNYPELSGYAWGWAVDTATHLLRIICSGAFDQFPNLKIIIGHMGEMLPFHLRRIERGFAKVVAPKKMKRNIFEYFRNNVYVTTSGIFDNAALTCALQTIGIDNILFSVDDPFEDNATGVYFLKTTSLSLTDREKLAYRNAEKILKI